MKTNDADARPVLTPDEAGAMLGLSPFRVTRLMDLGHLRSVEVGTGRKRHRRTSAAWVEAFRRGQTVGSALRSGPESTRASPVRGLEYAGKTSEWLNGRTV